MEATVYKSTGSWYITKAGDKIYNARLKGIFKIDEISSTNPIAVGDIVEIEVENEIEDTATIIRILDRKNYITRISPHNKNQHHIVASNLDQALLFATIKDPKTSQGFIDRFLVSAEAYHIPTIIVFNKYDLYKQKEQDKFDEIKKMYENIGYPVFNISVINNAGIDEIKNLLTHKATLLSGHSGVGKSSFINAIFPAFKLKIQDVSGWSGKGMHTTTFAEMFDLSFGGRIIDTPGIKELGLVSISKQELSHYFPEMRKLMNECQFNNCIHMNEPGCAIKHAVEEGSIHLERYLSYCTILEKIEEKTY